MPIIWVGSPIVGAFAAAVTRDILGVSAVHSAVYNPVISAVRGAVRSAVGDAVHSAVHSAIRSAVGGGKITWHYWLGGGLWSWWSAYESFFREVCGLRLDDDLSDRAEAYAETASAGCCWWPNMNFIMACERPTSIRFDDEGRLHSETGKSIEWPDGWGLYSWHGTTIPGEWIEDKNSLTPDIALTWENAEQRRAACEIIGWNSLLEKMGARLIDKDEDDTVGRLYEVNHEALGGRCRFLQMYCPTGRWFAEPVPPDMKTAPAANAWGWGLNPGEYKPTFQS